jgi:hypothetical protein
MGSNYVVLEFPSAHFSISRLPELSFAERLDAASIGIASFSYFYLLPEHW